MTANRGKNDRTIRDDDPLRLRYLQPATVWEEALPVGNGRLGAMVFGRTGSERIALNEDSVWYGGPRDRNNPDARERLEEVRGLLRQGRPREAEELAMLALAGVPESQRHYEPLGDLHLHFAGASSDIGDYSRELSLKDGIATIRYEAGGIRYCREVFVSYPDQALVVRLTADAPGALSLQARLTRGPNNRHFDEIRKLDDAAIVMRGQTGGGGPRFRTVVRALTEGGKLSVVGERIVVEGADAATFVVAAATSFRFDDPEAEAVRAAREASERGCVSLRERHAVDVSALMERVRLRLPSSPEREALPTDERLKLVREGQEDCGLAALYYQFGRYLLLSCSRPGSLPATLQGIWNESMQPPWDSKYTININTQMNYWPAETGNLAECHEPLFDLLERMRETGRVTARKMYGCGGFVAHHNTDLWADTAPQDLYRPATIWPMGAAWLSLHLWEHYLFSKDKPFLERAYPTLKDAAEFFVGFLTEATDGSLVTNPSVSPENTYVLPNGNAGTMCLGPSMDSQILYELFTACLAASEALGRDVDFARSLLRLRERLPEPKVGRHGELLEWLEEYEEAEPGHRHISHLFALHPGARFTVRGTPQWTAAARTTLERRLAHGGGHTGWSRAWIANLWARLEDGEKAWENVRLLLSHSTLPNLFDNHPPFQIDGNFGGAAGIAEMLAQSHAGEIRLLPALPAAWADGEVFGLRARGGYELDLRWSDGRLDEAAIRAGMDGRCVLNAGVPVRVSCGGRDIDLDECGGGAIAWDVSAGSEYAVRKE
ncbi:alpha-L-fucosidase [Cohnella sp. CIP 111063]|uniref:glycoside hydrolase family 95 protein n=1 Tax=unclassified Cohnella TaxID=2636738 RepID=UPI000B8C4B92|nr:MULTISPECIES: glycoside hydrolase family 95 protein [unclassified Cohnella]OXS61754.1 alpha-L-fucosidase [Cohnella sp. CIP 111063]PRX74191.1 alpha-L-fucosidase 2 [Cohnella sp. SGD-V74]